MASSEDGVYLQETAISHIPEVKMDLRSHSLAPASRLEGVACSKATQMQHTDPLSSVSCADNNMNHD